MGAVGLRAGLLKVSFIQANKNRLRDEWELSLSLFFLRIYNFLSDRSKCEITADKIRGYDPSVHSYC